MIQVFFINHIFYRLFISKSAKWPCNIQPRQNKWCLQTRHCSKWWMQSWKCCIYKNLQEQWKMEWKGHNMQKEGYFISLNLIKHLLNNCTQTNTLLMLPKFSKDILINKLLPCLFFKKIVLFT